MLHDFLKARRTRAFRLRLLLFALCSSTILLLVLAGCNHKTPTPALVAVGFVGDAACAPCHAQEATQHRGSHHAQTMRPVDKASLGERVLTPGPIPDTAFTLYETPSGFSMGLTDSNIPAVPMNLALGSNRFAFTFVHIVDGHSIMELRETYHSLTHTWHITPGQTPMDENPLGRVYPEMISRRCLGCHATTLPADSVTPEPRFYGVGCESCHGPGQQHTDAVKSGNMTDLHMEKLGAMGATRLNNLCGRCHRTAQDVAPDQTDMTQRFAAYGLMKSRCYLESNDTLSCLTCHGPHENASRDPKSYEKVCLTCHTPPQATYGPSPTGRKPCPVNPRTGCIPCHMPKRAAGPQVLSDHYIRANAVSDAPSS